MSDCKVTVITPCYNSEKTIARTIESVLNQTKAVDEYIIIDGASTDRTVEIARSYEKSFEGRLRIYSEPDDGIYYAMNKGIQKATGDIIGIINSDDYYETNAVENILKCYHHEEYAIIYGMLRVLKDGREMSIYLKSADFLEEDMIAHPSSFVTKKAYERYGLFCEDYRYSADYEFMLRMKEKKDVAFIPCYDIISNFSIDGASGSAKAYLETLQLRYQKGFLPKKEYLRKSAKAKLAVILRR